MKGLAEPWSAVLQGASIGAVLGGGIAAANYYMKKHKNAVIDLKVPARYLHNNRELSQLLGRFTPLRDLSNQTRNLYDQMIISCNHVLSAEQNKAKGGEQYKASRSALQTIASAKALCREAAKLTQRGAQCEADPFEVMRDIETIESLVNNHLHNIMLG
jgi:hypothetical protein